MLSEITHQLCWWENSLEFYGKETYLRIDVISQEMLSLGIVSSWCVMTLSDLLEHLFSFGKYTLLLFGCVLCCHVMGAVYVVILLGRNQGGFLQGEWNIISIRTINRQLLKEKTKDLVFVYWATFQSTCTSWCTCKLREERRFVQTSRTLNNTSKTAISVLRSIQRQHHR